MKRPRACLTGDTMAKRKPSLWHQAVGRLNKLSAYSQSRHEAKREHWEATGQKTWSHSTGRIHSYGTRDAYQQQLRSYIRWVREEHGIKTLVELDARSRELGAAWLREQLEAGRSPNTVQTQRAALRMFHSDRSITESVRMPIRHREEIIRSRGEVAPWTENFSQLITRS